MPAAALRKYEVGGVVVMKLKLRSDCVHVCVCGEGGGVYMSYIHDYIYTDECSRIASYTPSYNTTDKLHANN